MINILIVDDEPLVRASVQSFLDWEEYSFSFTGEAANGKQALEFLDEHPETDIILLDIYMPVMDGIQFMEELKLRKNKPLVLILSANDQYSYVRKAFQLGAVDYILKSDMDEENLLDQLKKTAELLEERENQNSSGLSRKEKQIIITSLMDDLFHSRNTELNSELLDEMGSLPVFPCILACFHFAEEEPDSRQKKIIQLRAHEFLKQTEKSSFHLLPDNTGVFILPPENAGQFCNDFREILKDAMNFYPDFTLSSLCLSLKDFPAQFEYAEHMTTGESRIVRRAKKYIKKHYESPALSLEEVSLHVEVSRTHLSAQFSKESEMTFRDYLTRTRVEAAKKLLRETNLRIYEISEKVGYPSVEHFSRIFKKTTGISPNRYHE